LEPLFPVVKWPLVPILYSTVVVRTLTVHGPAENVFVFIGYQLAAVWRLFGIVLMSRICLMPDRLDRLDRITSAVLYSCMYS